MPPSRRRTPTTKPADTDRKRFRITLTDPASGDRRTLELASSQLGPGDDLISRQQTGIPVQPFFEEHRFGPDSLLILWWMARRKAGEVSLRWDQVLAEFPTYEAMADADAELVLVDEDDDDADPPEEPAGT